MLHQVGHPPQNASGIAKQIVRLAGHSASEQLNVDLKAIIRASCNEKISFSELAQKYADGPDMENQGRHPCAQNDGSSLSAL